MEMIHRGWVTPKWWKSRWFKIVAFIAILFIIGGGIFLWKAGSTINKITSGGIFKNIASIVPGLKDGLDGEGDGRINIILLGMRGQNIPGGGLLADTIMVVSLKLDKNQPQNNKVSIVSIPRDLYVRNPGWGNQTKINAVYAVGEENGKKQGLADMQKVVGEISGLPIHYGMVINFKGFTDLVNALGGINVNLSQPFEEGIQFRGLEQRCDDIRFIIPSGNSETKRIKRKNGTYYANPKIYPLCFEKIAQEAEKELECGGNFKLPAGDNHLDGEIALCYARARYGSSDFERAKRQQIVIESIKAKAMSAGTLTDFSKINGMIDSLGDNVKTDMQLGEMKDFLSLYQKMPDAMIINKVIDTSENGLLYHPEETKESGYILLPKGDNYERIHEFFQSIFN